MSHHTSAAIATHNTSGAQRSVPVESPDLGVEPLKELRELSVRTVQAATLSGAQYATASSHAAEGLSRRSRGGSHPFVARSV